MDTHLPLFVALAVFLGCVVGLIFSPVKISRPHLVTFAMVTLAAVATCVLYWRYSTKPWTHDGQVRANVVGIAPRVAGPIIQIPIKDQAVRKGDLLFEIDPSTFQAASITSAKPSTGCGFPTVSSPHSRDGHPSRALAHRANRLGRGSGRVVHRATKSLLIREK